MKVLSSVLTDPALHIHRHPQQTSPVSSGTVWEGDQLVFNVCQCEENQNLGSPSSLTGRAI